MSRDLTDHDPAKVRVISDGHGFRGSNLELTHHKATQGIRKTCPLTTMGIPLVLGLDEVELASSRRPVYGGGRCGLGSSQGPSCRSPPSQDVVDESDTEEDEPESDLEVDQQSVSWDLHRLCVPDEDRMWDGCCEEPDGQPPERRSTAGQDDR